ncbi:MAG: hypothetical protein ABI867_06165 [Kofleriaceae bacterium]
MRLLTSRMLALALVAGCVSESEPDALQLAESAQDLSVTSVAREHVAGDVYHYSYVVRVGSAPNAQLHIDRVVRERAPWIPRRSTGAVMMLHGDFATFTTNFLPAGGGIAGWLAARDIDVWGTDRRWTQAEAEGDLSDFGAMGVVQELDDIGAALGFARAIRVVTDASTDRLTLIGFSRGGALAYFYASREATRPIRHVKGLVPLDVYVSLAPADEEFRLYICDLAQQERDALAAGNVDVPNSFQIETGQGVLDDPNGPSPYGLSNRDLMLWLAAQTWDGFFRPSPFYHLVGPTLGDDGLPTGLRFTSETVVAQWLADSPPHQAMRESLDTDALTCGDGVLPADVPLSRIRVPLLLVAAAGGYGERAIYSTTQVSSTDATTLVVRQLPVAQEQEDFGHGDLLYSPQAPALAWQPLLAWLRGH